MALWNVASSFLEALQSLVKDLNHHTKPRLGKKLKNKALCHTR